MNFPLNCPNCKKHFDDEVYLLQRSPPNWDSEIPNRIEDTIMECSGCHTLFRLRWKLVGFTQLKEIVVDEETKED